MRILGLATLALIAGCSVAPAAAPADPNAFLVDAKGMHAVVDQTLTLDGLGQPIGYVSAVSRCSDLLLFADSGGQVRRLNVTTGTTLPSIAADAAGGVLVIGGTWLSMPSEGGYQHPPIDKFYSDKKLGIGVALDSGQARPWLSPYDPACRAHCAFSTLSRVVGQGPGVWLATQSSSREVAFFDANGAVRQRFDITSPLFIDDGSVLRTLGGEPDVRWSGRNSLVKSSDQFAEIVATIHFRTRVPDDYVFGQSTEFDYWLNLHAMDGRKLVSDIKLPGMPIGRDDTHIYVTDYGPDGRHSAPDKLKILRIPVKAGTEGFKR